MKIVKVAGISTAFLITTGVVLGIKKRIGNRKTALLLSAIQTKIGKESRLLSAEKAFDLNYKDRVTGQVSQTIIVLKKQVARIKAAQIESAWGSWYEGGDNEARVYGVFRELKDKVQVSQVAGAYQERYGSNLIEVIKERLSANEIKQVLAIVGQLPNYRVLNT